MIALGVADFLPLLRDPDGFEGPSNKEAEVSPAELPPLALRVCEPEVRRVSVPVIDNADEVAIFLFLFIGLSMLNVAEIGEESVDTESIEVVDSEGQGEVGCSKGTIEEGSEEAVDEGVVEALRDGGDEGVPDTVEIVEDVRCTLLVLLNSTLDRR